MMNKTLVYSEWIELKHRLQYSCIFEQTEQKNPLSANFYINLSLYV